VYGSADQDEEDDEGEDEEAVEDEEGDMAGWTTVVSKKKRGMSLGTPAKKGKGPARKSL
jgi:hypothetical protein